MEKEHQPDSMATITMKPEYPPSEVSYSTSEPPPAYRQRGSNSVQIARIVALTVVASSFILGSFILASSWVSARASCHQLEQLDAMLDKELALEGRAYGNDGLLPDEPLPVGNAHALHAAPPLPSEAAPVSASAQQSQHNPPAVNQVKEDVLNQAESKIDEDKLQKIDNSNVKTPYSDSEENSDSDSSVEDEDVLDSIRPMFKLPIQFDLNELAGAFLSSSQKGRMNCVVERRHEEPERRFPFNILGAFAPRSAQSERVAIICHGGDEQRPMIPEPQSQVFAFPLSGPVRLPLRPQPERPQGQVPSSEPRMTFGPGTMQHRNMPFPLPLPWDSSEEQIGNNPREMRIHVQRVIAIPATRNMGPPPLAPLPPQDNMSPFAPPPPPPQHQDQNEQSSMPQMQPYVPQPAPIQELEQPEQKMMNNGNMGLPWGLTPEDLHMIQRTADDAVNNQRRDQQMDNDMQEVKTIVSQLAAAEAEAEAEAEEQRQGRALPQTLDEAISAHVPRTLLLPQEMQKEGRPHYVQPRSVRSVDAFHHREKRMKRCACDCA